MPDADSARHDPPADEAAAGLLPTMDQPAERHIRSFALRRGHVTQAQRRALQLVLPRFAFDPERGTDLRSAFGRTAPLVLEIGFGMGETTARLAAARPDVDFLCVEVFLAGIGALCKRIEEAGLLNIRIVHGDAVEFVARVLHDEQLAGVHVFFPDPWPKARHHKRRLIAQPFVGRLARRIARGGYLHCATDWEDYARQMREVLGGEPALRNAHAEAPDGYAPTPTNPLVERPTTKFHARGERLGHAVFDLVYLRV